MKRETLLAATAVILMIAACATPDTTNPVVTIVFPTTGATLDTGRVTIKARATDDKAVAKVEFYDGTTKIGEDGTGTADTFDVSWTATAGAHTLKAVASDAAGNTAEHSVNVTVTAGGGGGPTEHSEDIVGGDSIWYPAGNPHVVTRNLGIHDNGKLIVMPGCIVKFNTGAGFVVGYSTPGELQAVGKPDSLITFTSNAATPNPGDWLGFDFYGQTRTSTQISYCEINYAGYPNYGAINLEWGGTIKMDHTTIKNAPNYGIWAGEHGSYIVNFTGNAITACGNYPLYIYPENLSKLGTGNTLTGNIKDGIYVADGEITETGTWPNQGVPYVLGGNLSIASDAGAYLTIAKGSVVKLTSHTYITIGYIKPGGLKADSVTFTTAATTPQRGDWEGIWFYGDCTDAECRLSNCQIEYGGGDNYGNIWIEDAIPTISGCHIAHSAAYGIYLSGNEYPDPDSLEANNTFDDNASGNVRRP